MREYSLEINDVEYPWSSLYYKRSAPFMEDPIKAVIPMKQTVTGEHKIEILEDGVIKTTGRVHDFGYTRGKGGVYTTIIGSTLERDAAETEVHERLFLDQCHLAITNDITQIQVHKAAPRLTHGTINAGPTFPFEFGADWESRWKIRDAWERICQVTGFEIYVSPLGAVDFKDACGVDRGKTPAVSTTKFQTGENILNWTKPHREDQTMIAGEVIVIGRREGVYQAYGKDGAAKPTRKLYFKDLHTLDTCQEAAENIKDDMENAVITGGFNYIDEGLTYDVYDTVQIVDEDFGVDADYRIHDFTKWITPEKVYGNLTYCNLINMTGNSPLLINRGTGYLKKGQEALKQVTRTPTGLRDEARLFKYNGEDVTGYTIAQVAGGTVTVKKDYLTLSSGAGLGQSVIESTDPVMDFSSDLSLDFRFKINDIVDAAAERDFWIGIWNAGTTKGIYFNLGGYDLRGTVWNGPGNQTEAFLIDPITRDQWYRCSAFKRYGKVYWYVDSVFYEGVSTDVPVAGTSTTLYAQQLPNANAGANNYETYLDQFELHEKHVAEY